MNVLRIVSPGKTLVVALGLAGSVFQASAVPITVEEIGVGSHEIVEMTSSTLGTHWVYAGPLDLLVNGVATQGFCIDPFHWSATGPQDYNTEALELGPKQPGTMGAANALKIEQLWAHYYSHNLSNQDAVGLQLAIWEIVGGANFQLNSSDDYGAGAMLEWVNENPTATAADLIGVTGPGQDYAIPNVPDGGSTLALLGMGLAGLAAARSKFLAVGTTR